MKLLRNLINFFMRLLKKKTTRAERGVNINQNPSNSISKKESVKGKLRTINRNLWLKSKGYTVREKMIRDEDKYRPKKLNRREYKMMLFKNAVMKLTGYESISDARIPNSKRESYRKQARLIAGL